jgi:hypothetical protein
MGNTDYCSARAFAIKPSRPPCAGATVKALGLDGAARPSKRGSHALECKSVGPFPEPATSRIPCGFAGYLDVQADELFTRGGSTNLATGVHSAGGGAQRWGAPVLTKWPMKIDARLKTWEAPDEQTVDAVQTRV